MRSSRREGCRRGIASERSKGFACLLCMFGYLLVCREVGVYNYVILLSDIVTGLKPVIEQTNIASHLQREASYYFPIVPVPFYFHYLVGWLLGFGGFGFVWLVFLFFQKPGQS